MTLPFTNEGVDCYSMCTLSICFLIVKNDVMVDFISTTQLQIITHNIYQNQCGQYSNKHDMC